MPGKLRGIPVKDYIAQSSAFLICALALLAAAIDRARARQRAAAAGLALLAALFLANIFYVATGRTALVAIALLLVVLVLREFGWKGDGARACLRARSCLVGCGFTSPLLRMRVLSGIEGGAASTATTMR